MANHLARNDWQLPAISLTQLPNHTTDIEQANLYAAFCVAFAGFLRVGEFICTTRDLTTFDFQKWHITNASINLKLDIGVSLTLPASKTDPFRTGVTVRMPTTNDEACPKAALLNLACLNQPGPRPPCFKEPTGDLLTANTSSTPHAPS